VEGVAEITRGNFSTRTSAAGIQVQESKEEKPGSARRNGLRNGRRVQAWLLNKWPKSRGAKLLQQTRFYNKPGFITNRGYNNPEDRKRTTGSVTGVA
jgi:hypothetical protein